MSFVRTVLGDIDPADLGPTDAHAHLVIAGGKPVELEPDFLLADLERGLAELAEAKGAGLRAVVDAMPCDAGRDVRLLAELSRRSGVHVVAPTGLHRARYYDDRHWSLSASEEELADLFVADIEVGIDERDYNGPLVRRAPHRAGVIKVAGSLGRLTDLERRIFAAAAAAQRRTGCPILTHCQDGTAGLEQLRVLADGGADLRHVVLSHTDKIVDRGYHRELLSTSAAVEYDQGFRWPAGAENGTVTLLRWMVEDGFGERLMLGTDAARQGYWHAYGGEPGLVFLVGPFAATLAAAGIGPAEREALLVANPARIYAFGAVAS